MGVKRKFFHVYGKAVDSKGKSHYVTVLGELQQWRGKELVQDVVPVEVKPNSFTNGVLTYEQKKLTRKLTLSMSICHPSDTFDEEIGVKIAKGRLKKGEILGELMTNNVTMLTDDAIIGELLVKLSYITDNIENYIP